MAKTPQKIFAALGMLALCFGCSDDKSGTVPAPDPTKLNLLPETAENTGCVQGVLVDGQNNERMEIGQESIYVLVQSKRFYASPSGDQTDSRFKGEFYVCDIPVDESYPIFAAVKGYHNFDSVIHIEAYLPRKNPKEQPIRKPRPSTLANIRVFPKGVETQNFVFQVFSQGKVMSDATVRLMPSQASFFDSQDFLMPTSSRTNILVEKTDSNGNAVFKATELMLGGSYRYLVIPPNSGANEVVASGAIQVGLKEDKDSSGKQDPFRVLVDLSSARFDLQVISTNATTKDVINGGTLFYVFNRAIEIVPGTADEITASLSNSIQAKLVENKEGNNQSEQVAISIVGNRLELSPRFEVDPDAVAEPELKIDYANILVRPVEGPGRMLAVPVKNASTPFFGGKNPKRVAKGFKVETNLQSAEVVRSVLPLSVLVTDQNGYALPGQTVTFDALTDGSSVSSNAQVSNSEGRVLVSWTLASKVGIQELSLKAPGIEKPQIISVKAISASPGAMNLVSGDYQQGPVGSLLGSPLKVTVYDAYSNLVSNAVVNFNVTSGGGKISNVATKTDASGVAQVSWTLGSYVGTQTVTASLANMTSVFVKFSATATAGAPTVVVPYNGIGQSAVVATTLPQPIQFVVKDSFGNAVSGSQVNFEVVGGGAVNPSTAISSSTGVVTLNWTLGTQAGVQSVAAYLSGNTEKTVVSAVAKASSASKIASVSGNEQVGAPKKTLPEPLVLKVVDAYNNPVSDVTISAKVAAGTGSLSSTSETTDENGFVQFTWTLGAEANQVVKFFSTGLTEVSFTATAKP